MKISELTERLKIIQDTFGDIDVSVWDGDNCTLFDAFEVGYLPSENNAVINRDNLCE